MQQGSHPSEQFTADSQTQSPSRRSIPRTITRKLTLDRLHRLCYRLLPWQCLVLEQSTTLEGHTPDGPPVSIPGQGHALDQIMFAPPSPSISSNKESFFTGQRRAGEWMHFWVWSLRCSAVIGRTGCSPVPSTRARQQRWGVCVWCGVRCLCASIGFHLCFFLPSISLPLFPLFTIAPSLDNRHLQETKDTPHRLDRLLNHARLCLHRHQRRPCPLVKGLRPHTVLAHQQPHPGRPHRRARIHPDLLQGQLCSQVDLHQ